MDSVSQRLLLKTTESIYFLNDVKTHRGHRGTAQNTDVLCILLILLAMRVLQAAFGASLPLICSQYDLALEFLEPICHRIQGKLSTDLSEKELPGSKYGSGNSDLWVISPPTIPDCLLPSVLLKKAFSDGCTEHTSALFF